MQNHDIPPHVPTAGSGPTGTPGEDGPDHGKAKEITIYVNTKPKRTTARELTFEQIVALADGLPSGPDIQFTVTVSKGHGPRPDDDVAPGETVKLKDEMVFSVSFTNRS